METMNRNPIAITGIACRVPGAQSGPELWEILRSSREMTTGRIPEDHSATASAEGTYRSGGLADPWGFDTEFFGIAPREAHRLDPQHRQLLEVSAEALADAGLRSTDVAGHEVSVYVGQHTQNFWERQLMSGTPPDIYGVTGSGMRAGASGRISWAFDLRGPSMTIDTACSAGLSAIHLAVQDLRRGAAEMAIAGATNMILAPHETSAYLGGGMLSQQGRCRFGDADADGFVRTEGVGVIVLRPLADALRLGDRIYATVLGTASGNDGRSSGSRMKPSRAGQASVLRAAYADAQVDPAAVRFVEAHGTGTPAGDPVELSALAEVLGDGRPDHDPLLVGSVKSNIGHAEAAAGVLGTIKAALALHHGLVPRSLHCDTPHPGIAWDSWPLRIADEPCELTGEPGDWLAGVSATGLSGTNVHVVLGGATQHDRPADQPPPATLTLGLSARDPAALAEVADRCRARLREGELADAADVCWTVSARRTAGEWRAALTASDVDELREGLAAVASSPPASPAPARRVVFVTSGHGSQWRGMTRALRRSQPVFEESLRACDAAIAGVAGWSLLERLDDDERWLVGVPEVQPGLWAISVALGHLWRSWGVRPDLTIGHSMGEVAAACLSEALSLDDGARVICARSALMGETAGEGAMGVVGLPRELVEARLAAFGDVDVAAVNGRDATVISGAPVAVGAALEAFEREAAFARAIDIDIAAHSGRMEPLVERLREATASIEPREAVVPMVSAVTAAGVRGEDLGPDYWARNLREPVRFADAIEHILADGPALVVELAPHPVLASVLEELLGGAGPGSAFVAASRRGDEVRAALDAAATAFERGAELDWARVLERRQVTDVPSYPWRRDVIAGPPPELAQVAGGGGRAASDSGPPVVTVAGADCLAGPGIVAHMTDAIARSGAPAGGEIAGIEFLQPIAAPPEPAPRVELRSRPGATACVVRPAGSDEPAAHAVVPAAGRPPAARLDLPAIARRTRGVGLDALADALDAAGIAAHTPGATLTELALGAGEALARIDASEMPADAPRIFGMPAAVLECAALAGAALLPGDGAYVGRRIGRLSVAGAPAAGSLLAHVRLCESDADVVGLDVALASPEGDVLALVEQLQLQRYRVTPGHASSDLVQTHVLAPAEEDHMSFNGLVRVYGPGEQLLIELQMPATAPRPAWRDAAGPVPIPAPAVALSPEGYAPAPALLDAPLNGHGAPAAAAVVGEAPAGVPAGDVAEMVRSAIAELLQLDAARVNPARTLADLGFDSLMTAKLRRRIASMTGTSLQPADVPGTMTVEALVERAAA